MFPCGVMGVSECLPGLLLLCNSLQMHPPRFRLSFAFPSATGAAADRACPDLPFGDFVPPFLLGGGPDFLLATVSTREGLVNIKPSRDEQRSAITVVGTQCEGINRDRTVGHRLFLLPSLSFDFKFESLLLVAFHGNPRHATSSTLSLPPSPVARTLSRAPASLHRQHRWFRAR